MSKLKSQTKSIRKSKNDFAVAEMIDELEKVELPIEAKKVDEYKDYASNSIFSIKMDLFDTCAECKNVECGKTCLCGDFAEFMLFIQKCINC